MTDARLLITADDYGYSPEYNRGIVEAARAGAIDAVGAMVMRPWCDPAPLLDAGAEIGLHLERSAPVGLQVERFERLFGGPPAFLDGHHHCHAEPGLEGDAIHHALRLGVRVRSIDPPQRLRLAGAGVATPARLIGRLEAGEPLLPPEVAAVEGGAEAVAGLTEWMTHPGHPDPGAGSGYDAARAADLEELLRLGEVGAIRDWRAGSASGTG
jgi:predicted glycoside hydrolase/deacetylase ChbG (UPF0249 family)